jgi:prophage tail gpP-like protein
MTDSISNVHNITNPFGIEIRRQVQHCRAVISLSTMTKSIENKQTIINGT